MPMLEKILSFQSGLISILKVNIVFQEKKTLQMFPYRNFYANLTENGNHFFIS